jgi:hypothetical protein
MKMAMILGSMLLFLTATAQAAEPAADNAAAGDPDQRVCRVVNEIGSRLATHRVCKTRAEWAEQGRQTREGINRAQTRQFNLRIDERVLVEAPR